MTAASGVLTPTGAPTGLTDAAASTLQRWHSIVASGNLAEVATLIHPEAEFCSPAFWKPYCGQAAVAHVLQAALTVLEEFTYHREFATDDGHHVVLEFSARVGDLQLKGADFVAFDADGRIVHFEVMIRPMRSLQALAERMRAAVDPVVLGVAPA